MKITKIVGRQILDSRGLPTVEVEVTLDDGSLGRAAVPSGASTGKYEAVELRDGGPEYSGKGVQKALDNIKNMIMPAVVGMEAADQSALDQKMIELDGTENKSKLGANAILAVSLAIAKAAAVSQKLPLFRYVSQLAGNQNYHLPIPMFNVLNGGAHALGSTDIQEFMIVPIKAKTFAERLRIGAEIFQDLKSELKDKGYATTVGDEGGFAPAFQNGDEEALEFLVDAIKKSGYTPGVEVSIALDVAASELYESGKYDFKRAKLTRDSNQMLQWYQSLKQQFPIISIEDGFSQDDWQGWQQMMLAMGHDIQIVGDDLVVTNPQLIAKASEQKAANAAIIKPNQIGTLSETIESVSQAHKAGWKTIMSHRSGETEDVTIAHLAVGLNTAFIKSGSVSRGERTAKYNELLRIEEALGLADS